MKRNAARLLADRKLLVIIVALIGILAIEDRNFFTLQTLVSLFDHVAINGVMAAGMTILLISGSFDLSIGSVMAITGIIIVLSQQFGMIPSILIGLAAGTA